MRFCVINSTKSSLKSSSLLPRNFFGSNITGLVMVDDLLIGELRKAIFFLNISTTHDSGLKTLDNWITATPRTLQSIPKHI